MAWFWATVWVSLAASSLGIAAYRRWGERSREAHATLLVAVSLVTIVRWVIQL